VRKLAQEIGVSKNTATEMLKRLREATLQDRKLLEAIAREVGDLQ
jgi:Mn-dependent DtxR family transcriptional regulator